MRKMVLCGIILIGLGFGALAAEAVTLSEIVAASTALKTFQATIFMTRHTGGQKAEIEFEFKFVPPDRMRIEYLFPKNLAGQLVILNGDRLYTYLPALNRAVRKTVTGKSGHPGEEMGFLYYFVERDLSAFTADHTAAGLAGPQPFTWKHGTDEITYQAYKLTFIGDKEKQVVWCDAATLVPIGVDIYQNGKLSIELRVVNYTYNGPLSADEFVIPE